MYAARFRVHVWLNPYHLVEIEAAAAEQKKAREKHERS